LISAFFIINALTLSRIVIAPILARAIGSKNDLMALSLLAIAFATDVLDGWLARKLKKESEIGRILDPLADKLLVLIVSYAFFERFNISMLFWVLFVLQDTALAIGALILKLKKRKVLAPSLYGKAAMGLFMLSVGIKIVAPMITEFLGAEKKFGTTFFRFFEPYTDFSCTADFWGELVFVITFLSSVMCSFRAFCGYIVDFFQETSKKTFSYSTLTKILNIGRLFLVFEYFSRYVRPVSRIHGCRTMPMEYLWFGLNAALLLTVLFPRTAQRKTNGQLVSSSLLDFIIYLSVDDALGVASNWPIAGIGLVFWQTIPVVILWMRKKPIPVTIIGKIFVWFFIMALIWARLKAHLILQERYHLPSSCIILDKKYRIVPQEVEIFRFLMGAAIFSFNFYILYLPRLVHKAFKALRNQ
jgi:cardiolipin synthase (CMP-forming)